MVPQSQYSPEEIVRLGEAMYEETLRAKVETAHKGKFLVLDIATGEYEIDASDVAAVERLRNRLPDAVVYGLRIGHRAAYRIGGLSKARN